MLFCTCWAQLFRLFAELRGKNKVKVPCLLVPLINEASFFPPGSSVGFQLKGTDRARSDVAEKVVFTVSFLSLFPFFQKSLTPGLSSCFCLFQLLHLITVKMSLKLILCFFFNATGCSFCTSSEGCRYYNNRRGAPAVFYVTALILHKRRPTSVSRTRPQALKLVAFRHFPPTF